MVLEKATQISHTRKTGDTNVPSLPSAHDTKLHPRVNQVLQSRTYYVLGSVVGIGKGTEVRQ